MRGDTNFKDSDLSVVLLIFYFVVQINVLINCIGYVRSCIVDDDFFLNMCMKTHLPLFNVLSEVPQNHNRFSLLLLYLFIVLKPFYPLSGCQFKIIIIETLFWKELFKNSGGIRRKNIPK